MRTFSPTVAQSMHEKAPLKKGTLRAMTVLGYQARWPRGVSRMRDGRSPAARKACHQRAPRNGEAMRKYGIIAALRWLVRHRHPRPRHPVTGRCQNPLLENFRVGLGWFGAHHAQYRRSAEGNPGSER